MQIFQYLLMHIAGCKTQRNEAGELSTDYLIKWEGLPYSCCTEEDGLLIDRLFPKAVDEYNSRLRSACTPNKLCRVCSKTKYYIHICFCACLVLISAVKKLFTVI